MKSILQLSVYNCNRTANTGGLENLKVGKHFERIYSFAEIIEIKRPKLYFQVEISI